MAGATQQAVSSDRSAGRDAVQRAAAWALNVVMTVLLAVLGWNVQRLTNSLDDQEAMTAANATRLTTIEANRFTVADGLKMQAELARVWTEVATFPSKDNPGLERRLEDILRRLDRLETWGIPSRKKDDE